MVSLTKGICAGFVAATLAVAFAVGVCSPSEKRVLAAPTTAAAAPAPAANKSKKIDFNRDVRPILSDNCFRCHGHDPGHRKAELRVDTKEGLFSVKDDVATVVPGKP